MVCIGNQLWTLKFHLEIGYSQQLVTNNKLAEKAPGTESERTSFFFVSASFASNFLEGETLNWSSQTLRALFR